MVIAKRLVEHKRDVVILLIQHPSARAYNTVVPSSGKVLTGGGCQCAAASETFGAARNIEQGNATIIATALIETGSRMDEVIEEFKGTGNSEVILIASCRQADSQRLTSRGQVHARKNFVDKGTLAKMWVLRRILMQMGPVDAMEFLVDN